jgi:hypothetical protein
MIIRCWRHGDKDITESRQFITATDALIHFSNRLVDPPDVGLLLLNNPAIRVHLRFLPASLSARSES